MVSLHLSSMWQARVAQTYALSSRLSHKQQRPWIDNVYRSATCQFSKSCGPVRYSPRSTKQPKNPSKREDDEHTKSYQHDAEETHKHVPPMSSLAHRFQGDSKRSSVNSTEVFEADMNTHGMPINSLDFSDSFRHSGKYQEESCTRSGFSYEEEGNRATMYSSKHASEWRDKGPRHSHGSSTDLAKFSISTKMQQTWDKEARSNVGSNGILENGLDIAVEKAQTKEKNPFAFMESDVERKTCPQGVKTIPSLPILGKHPMKREADFQEGKQLPYRDVESFLLKVQKAKQGGQERLNAATSIEGSLCINDNNKERDDSDDDSLFLGQETLHEKEIVSLVSNSTAAQEHAKNQAIRYLAMRPYTAFQLRKKLESRDITSELADYAIATVQNCGLQSDLLYAETFSRSRFNYSSWGPQRIKLGLQQRGISNEIIRVAIARVFREEENDSEQYGTSQNETKSNSPEISRAAMDHLLVQATKQWNRGRNVTNETKVRRMVSWLQYRGFNYSVIKTVLKHLHQNICIEDE